MSIGTAQSYKIHIEKGALPIMMNVRSIKPPLPLRVMDLANLARLTITRPDSQTLLWMFQEDGEWVLGSLFSIPYWRGNLPMFSYIRLPREVEPKPYLAYKNIGSEEVFLTDSNEDPKYLYGAVIEASSPPRFLGRAMRTKRMPSWIEPMRTKTKDINSLVRLLLIMSDNMGSPPIWRFKAADDRYVLGVLAPFFDYYEATALPVFIYVETEEESSGGFIKYITSNGREESSFTDCIGDMKYFYARVIMLLEAPLWYSKNHDNRSRAFR